jgi:hypothetical protein
MYNEKRLEGDTTMVNTWEVYVWTLTDHGYAYVQVYGGENEAEAWRIARDKKDSGCGCIKIEWR